MTTNPPLALTGVEQQFAEWRRTRTNLKTPLALKEQAVKLLSDHGTNAICQALHINHDMLKRWRRELTTAASEPAAFVELANALPSPTSAPMVEGHEPLQLTLTYACANGNTASVHGQLSPNQWQWALQLLAQPR